MGIIKNIETRIKLVKTVAICSLVLSLTIAVMAFVFTGNQLAQARRTIYILDKDTPILAKQTDQQVNRPVEYRAHVDLFHSLFFTITPDNSYIEYQLRKAMYLVDESGIQQYNNLKEKSFYNQIMSSSAVLTITTDSIALDVPERYFRFYGRQRIDRKTSYVIRSLITEGYLQDVPRSANNPHGIIIQRWRTLENNDLSTHTKNVI